MTSRIVVVGLLLLAGSISASATPVYSNLGPGDTYDLISINGATGLTSSAGSDLDTASPFTPTADSTFDSVEAALTWLEGTNAIDVWLMSDAGGVPGAIIEAFHFAGLPPFATTDTALAVGTSALHPALLAGVQYWIAASADGDSVMGFNDNVIGVLSVANRVDGGPWTVDGTMPSSAFRINGTAVAVPEPASVYFLGSALAFVLARRRLRRA